MLRARECRAQAAAQVTAEAAAEAAAREAAAEAAARAARAAGPRREHTQGVIDLHTHSRCSDGTDPPERIVELASVAGLTAVALTDHDTFSGLDAARSRAEELGIALVGGCEVSCAYRGASAHVLVYFARELDGPLAEELVTLRRDRVWRNRAVAERLVDLGFPDPYEEVVSDAAREDSVGRPHFAAWMVRKGFATSIPDAFERFLAEGRPAHVAKEHIRPGEIAAAARASGGVVALAHPHTLGLEPEALDRAAGELAEMGFSGLECHYARYDPGAREALAAIARRHGLVATGGSDYHGLVKEGLAVGVGEGDLRVEDAVLDELQARRPCESG